MEDGLGFRRAPSLVSTPFEDDATAVVRHIWLHFSRLQSAEWHAHVTFIPRSGLSLRRPRGIMELTRSWKHNPALYNSRVPSPGYCTSHVKRTYNVLLHTRGSRAASATIISSQSIKLASVCPFVMPGKTLGRGYEVWVVLVPSIPKIFGASEYYRM